LFPEISLMTHVRPTLTARHALLALLASLAALPAASVAQAPISNTFSSGGSTQLDAIVALVDDDVILRSELDLAMVGIEERIRATGTMPPQNLLNNRCWKADHT
jgi:hypothetical protein